MICCSRAPRNLERRCKDCGRNTIDYKLDEGFKRHRIEDLGRIAEILNTALNSQVWEEPRHVNNQRAMGATVENFDMLEYHNRLVDIKNDVLRAWHLAALGQEPSYGDYYSVG